jgi:tRNA threonylcarbamoyladenosine biosynthesis protein TsaB
MIILTLRTDKPEAEIGLFDGANELARLVWPAHRQLAETIHLQIKKLLDSNALTLSDIGGIVVFRGPGSFTGLRIGISVANALAAGLGLPIVGDVGNNWVGRGIIKLIDGENEKLVVPEYGSPPHTTKPKH